MARCHQRSLQQAEGSRDAGGRSYPALSSFRPALRQLLDRWAPLHWNDRAAPTARTAPAKLNSL